MQAKVDMIQDQIVLILILLEVGYWLATLAALQTELDGLNPYSTGSWLLIEDECEVRSNSRGS